MSRIANRSLAATFCLVLALSGAACSNRANQDQTATEPNNTSAPSDVQVTQVELGRDLNSDNRVTVQTDKFQPSDVVYVSVLTSGTSPSATLKSVWTYEDGQVVDESQQVISPSGDAVTEFHVSKPEGLPAGKYKVEISLNGSPVQSKDFQVVRT